MSDLNAIEMKATAAVRVEVAAADVGLKTDAEDVAGFIRRCGWVAVAVVAIVSAAVYWFAR